VLFFIAILQVFDWFPNVIKQPSSHTNHSWVWYSGTSVSYTPGWGQETCQTSR